MPVRPSFRDAFREYVERDLRINFDSVNQTDRSKYMARFYADRVIRPQNPGLLPLVEEDFASAIVDGADDCGVDFIACEPDSVFIVQAKYGGAKKQSRRQAESPGEFELFADVLSRLVAGPKVHRMNQKLREAISDIDWDRAAFQLHYITLNQVSDLALQRAKRLINPIQELPDLLDRTSLELLDEEQLNIALRESLSLEAEETRQTNVMFSKGKDNVPWIEFRDQRSGRRSFVGRISGSQVAEIYKANRLTLFAMNIRNYIGDNATNREIKKTALELSEEFFYYNNGIAALAKRIEADPDDREQRTLSCEQFSIINGAQTVRSIYKAHVEDPSKVRDVEVLLRISEFKGKTTPVEQDFLDRVTRYNNTQNAIKISDFRSNDRIQVDLKRRFENLPARRGKRFLYKSKRSGDRDVTRIPVGMEEFVKTIFSFMFGPDDVFGGTSYVFDPSKEGGYMKLFGDGVEISPGLSDPKFRYYVGVWFACEYVKDIWKAEREKTQQDPVAANAYERRWMLFFAVGSSIRNIYGSNSEDEIEAALGKMADPSWYLASEDHRTKAVIRRHAKLALYSLKSAYKQASSAPTFTHRNWFRRASTLGDIRTQLINVFETVEKLDDYRF